MPAYPGCPGKKAVKRVFCVQGCWVALWANNVFCCKCKKWFSDRDTCRTIDSSVHFWTWQLVFESNGKIDSWTWLESNKNVFHWIVQHYSQLRQSQKKSIAVWWYFWHLVPISTNGHFLFPYPISLRTSTLHVMVSIQQVAFIHWHTNFS